MKNDDTKFETVIDESVKNEPVVIKAPTLEEPKVETVEVIKKSSKTTEIVIALVIIALIAGIMIYLNYKNKNAESNG